LGDVHMRKEVHAESGFDERPDRARRCQPVPQLRHEVGVSERMVLGLAVACYPARKLSGEAQSKAIGLQDLVVSRRRPGDLHAVNLVCRLLLEKKKKTKIPLTRTFQTCRNCVGP